MRKLASVQKILSIQKIEGANNIELATVLGWNVVVRKGEFKIGDLVVYFEPDSLIPRYEWNSFLFKKEEVYTRLRVKKIRGIVSYGLVIPYNNIFNTEKKYIEGDDITEVLGVKKYEFTPPEHLRGKVSGEFPNFIRKTDEIRLQSIASILDRHREKTFYYSEKMDGSSLTCFINNGDFGVCSRNKKYYLDDNNAFSNAARKYNIKEKLESVNINVAIQSEVLAPGIQKNKYKFNDLQIFTFNVWNIDEQKYLDYADFCDFCNELNIQTVPILCNNFRLGDLQCSDLIELAKGDSVFGKIPREGLVFRPLNECLDYELGRLSWKCINPDYLLKYES